MAPRKSITETFDSLAAFVDYADNEGTRGEANRESRTGTESFTGTGSYDEAKGLAFGWHAGVERFEKLRTEFAPTNIKPRNEVRMREAGPGVISMGHYMAGHPQPFANLEAGQRAKRGKSKVVRLEVSLFVSAGVSNSVIERRGGVVVALADALERAGRRVEIYGNVCMAGSYGSKTHLNFKIRIKAAQQKLNLASLAFVMAHPAMYRRIGFSALEVHPEGGRFGAYGFYGYSAEPEAPEGAVKIPSLCFGNTAYRDDDTARDYIRSVLVEQGVTLKD